MTLSHKGTWIGALVPLSPRPGSDLPALLLWLEDGALVSWSEIAPRGGPEALAARVRTLFAERGVPKRVRVGGGPLFEVLRALPEVAGRVEEGDASECGPLLRELQQHIGARLHDLHEQRAQAEDQQLPPALQEGFGLAQRFLSEEGQAAWSVEARALLRALYRAKLRREGVLGNWSPAMLGACVLEDLPGMQFSERAANIAPQILDAYFSWLGARRLIPSLASLSLSDWCSERSGEIKAALRGT